MTVFEFTDNIYFFSIVNKDSDFYTEGRYIQYFLYDKKLLWLQRETKIKLILKFCKNYLFLI